MSNKNKTNNSIIMYKEIIMVIHKTKKLNIMLVFNENYIFVYKLLILK